MMATNSEKEFAANDVVIQKMDCDENTDNEEAGCGCFGAYGGCFHQCKKHPHQTNCINYENIKDNSCWFRIPKLYIRLNPLVTLISLGLIWGFVAFCMLMPEYSSAELAKAKTWITRTFTWLYIGSQDVWAIFVVVVFIKYGHIKLGKEDDKVEYTGASWFAMLFACGIGVGLFFYGVAESVLHYHPVGGGNRYISDRSMPDNTLAQTALNVTLYHWGIHGWVVYVIVAMLMGITSYRMGLPMTVKSCFYPLIGDKIFGWMGDSIDILSIVTTMLGVGTSLGLGTIQINRALNLINPDIPMSKIAQIIIIWGITALATASTLSGLGVGIRRLSEVCFGVGMVIMLTTFFLNNTWYILNLYVQSLGFYLQWLLQLGFHTDAFEQAGTAYGGKDRNRGFEDGKSDGPALWMDWWTIFYWGWWIAYSPSVGMFIARISKGRTIREFLTGAMTIPIFYVFFWLVNFGGIGIKMEREAAGAGLCCGHNFVNETMIDTIYLGQKLGPWVCEGNECNGCASSILNIEQGNHNDSLMFIKRMKTMKGDFGVTFDNRSLTRLTCHNNEQMWFDVMDSFGNLSGFLRILSIISIVLYFVTTSDSGSFVIDCLAANGDKDPPRIQRAFWAITEGATCTALVWVGGVNSLSALQTVSVVAGLPYTFIICLMCVALWRVLQVISGERNPYGPQFPVGFCDVLARPTVKSVFKVILCVTIAPYIIANAIIYSSGQSRKKERCLKIFYTISLALFLYGFVALCICSYWLYELWAFGIICLCAFAVGAGGARIKMRTTYNIDGNILEDIFCGLLYPLLSYQLWETINYHEKQRLAERKETTMIDNFTY